MKDNITSTLCETKPIKSSNKNINSKKIEASGVLWQANNKHYLVITDERVKKQSAIFIMDGDDLHISDQLIMQNYDFDDLESLSSDGTYIYALCSLSHNQNGKLKTRRKQFLRFQYRGNKVTNQQSINLYKILKSDIKRHPDSRYADFLSQAIKHHTMDIESHFVSDNQLYIGFKSPFIDTDKTLVLKLDSLNSLFENKTASIESWMTVALNDPKTKKAMRLSDMLLLKNNIYLLSVSDRSKNHSIPWRYQPKKQQLQMIKQFPGLKAEGLAYNNEQSRFIVVFDRGGKKSSKYICFNR